MTVRPHMVEALIQAAANGMEAVSDDSTPQEVVSACFTLTQRTIHAALDTHPENHLMMRQAVEVLLLACVDVRRLH